MVREELAQLRAQLASAVPAERLRELLDTRTPVGLRDELEPLVRTYEQRARAASEADLVAETRAQEYETARDIAHAQGLPFAKAGEGGDHA